MDPVNRGVRVDQNQIKYQPTLNLTNEEETLQSRNRIKNKICSPEPNKGCIKKKIGVSTHLCDLIEEDIEEKENIRYGSYEKHQVKNIIQCEDMPRRMNHLQTIQGKRSPDYLEGNRYKKEKYNPYDKNNRYNKIPTSYAFNVKEEPEPTRSLSREVSFKDNDEMHHSIDRTETSQTTVSSRVGKSWSNIMSYIGKEGRIESPQPPPPPQGCTCMPGIPLQEQARRRHKMCEVDVPLITFNSPLVPIENKRYDGVYIHDSFPCSIKPINQMTFDVSELFNEFINCYMNSTNTLVKDLHKFGYDKQYDEMESRITNVKQGFDQDCCPSCNLLVNKVVDLLVKQTSLFSNKHRQKDLKSCQCKKINSCFQQFDQKYGTVMDEVLEYMNKFNPQPKVEIVETPSVHEPTPVSEPTPPPPDPPPIQKKPSVYFEEPIMYQRKPKKKKKKWCFF